MQCVQIEGTHFPGIHLYSRILEVFCSGDHRFRGWILFET